MAQQDASQQSFWRIGACSQRPTGDSGVVHSTPRKSVAGGPWSRAWSSQMVPWRGPKLAVEEYSQTLRAPTRPSTREPMEGARIATSGCSL
eukprot:2743227-Amphidinium_carterae.1